MRINCSLAFIAPSEIDGRGLMQIKRSTVLTTVFSSSHHAPLSPSANLIDKHKSGVVSATSHKGRGPALNDQLNLTRLQHSTQVITSRRSTVIALVPAIVSPSPRAYLVLILELLANETTRESSAALPTVALTVPSGGTVT